MNHKDKKHTENIHIDKKHTENIKTKQIFYVLLNKFDLVKKQYNNKTSRVTIP